MQTQNVLPAFEVEKLEGTRTKTIHTPKKGGGFDLQEVKIDAGYMVYFPRGHSIRVDEAELKRSGFDRDPRLVDMKTGEEAENPSGMLKRRVERKTHASRSSQE